MFARPAVVPPVADAPGERGVYEAVCLTGTKIFFDWTSDAQLLYGVHRPALVEEPVVIARLADVLDHRDPIRDSASSSSAASAASPRQASRGRVLPFGVPRARTRPRPA
jgi:hypothetical protein